LFFPFFVEGENTGGPSPPPLASARQVFDGAKQILSVFRNQVFI
jgi:hypothetical protein